ncbi:hypothetical protein Desdi_0211 [Desulfitobacterium dichloroeliminans LMG P-21439]|uniref:DUF6591 domain-containing protein n=1 Tax=Desulfitobacterium dichloroeliminans (strain LMG P-21439 / DCA1) TaxID=871963 RepID=L0F3X4_DESDL|nr:DUF6591 domain-containing protein [Desulfitobacterium dichloroeliminans]AGA67765.1 hypothetical protein Desdi_0211 [Desulfitobacterium dichloroeliminans LMG P-21439]
MKKTLIFCFALFLVFTLTGCKSPSEAAAEKVSEKILEGATGGKVDLDGEKATIKTEDGSVVSFGGNEWPSDKLGEDIPKLNGKVTYVANSDAMCMIIIEGVKAGEFEKYVEKVKDAGFNQNEMNYSDNSTKTYMASNAKDIAFQLTYMVDTEEVSITAGKNEK